ncbi:MAG: polyphosphate kinase 1 [Tissierellia bacterium]|nr:polyphosphate kinase 1 [Tissierellia bacterium]
MTNSNVNTDENSNVSIDDGPKVNIHDVSQNRELSWLKFNERVLKVALDPTVPLYEKLKFISIFISNLDEFYMVRVGSLTDLSLLKKSEKDSKTGMDPKEQLQAIFKDSIDYYKEKDTIYESVDQILRETGIEDIDVSELTKDQKTELNNYYKYYVEPILSPMIIDSYHPFPFIENLLFAIIADISSHVGEKIALLPIPKVLPRVYYFKNSKSIRYIRMENIIKYYFPTLFTRSDVENISIIRVTRNADLTLESDIADEDFDYRQYMKKILKRRKRLQPVRVETDVKLQSSLRNTICKNLDITKEQIFITKTPMEISYVFSMKDNINGNKLDKLSFSPFKPQLNPHLDMNKKLIDQILEKDIMMIYPYEDIGQFLALLDEAAEDPNVVSIKITIYRLSSNSKIDYSLKKAADNGKDVTALMELRARFDEQHNIDYSEELISSGVNVIYGIENYKCHSKVCLITRKSSRGIDYITQIGTGNYNESTSKQYTDISFITSDRTIAKDAVNFFNDMQIGNLEGEYEKLLASPHTLKREFLKLIDKEIEKGEKGKLFFKFNSLTDKEFIMKFVEASKAGVQVRLIIRGICCIIPGFEGLTDNVKVRSIVGRYLEHSRIYIFGEGEDAKYYISSADLMTRNTMRRVEIAAPVENQKLKNKLQHYMDISWNDNDKARELKSDKNYDRIYREDDVSLSSQDYMMEYSIRKAKEFKPEAESKGIFVKIKEFFQKFKK